MKTLRDIVKNLKSEDDLRCRAISGLAKSQNIEYKKAEKMIDLMIREVAVCQ